VEPLAKRAQKKTANLLAPSNACAFVAFSMCCCGFPEFIPGLTLIYCRWGDLSRTLAPTEIPSIYPRESGGTGFPAWAGKRLNLMDIILIFFIKSILKN
jgi:hypothetical protein